MNPDPRIVNGLLLATSAGMPVSIVVRNIEYIAPEEPGGKNTEIALRSGKVLTVSAPHNAILDVLTSVPW